MLKHRELKEGPSGPTRSDHVRRAGKRTRYPKGITWLRHSDGERLQCRMQRTGAAQAQGVPGSASTRNAALPRATQRDHCGLEWGR